MTFEELLAIPERDEWVYSTGPSYVCSTYVANMLKIAGVFDGFDVQVKILQI